MHMCFFADFEHGTETPEEARAICHAAALAGRVEAEDGRPAFVGMVMMHAAQHLIERCAETKDLEPRQVFLALTAKSGVGKYETDPGLIEPVLSADREAGRFFARALRDEITAAGAREAAQLAAACIAIAIALFGAFARECGAGKDRGMGICAVAACKRLLAYEVLH
jgi:hypothetical protein